MKKPKTKKHFEMLNKMQVYSYIIKTPVVYQVWIFYLCDIKKKSFDIWYALFRMVQLLCWCSPWVVLDYSTQGRWVCAAEQLSTI